MLVASTLGPSLPPRVNGEVIGTLTICFEECSVADTFVRIQFWGAHTFSDLHLSKNGPFSEEENRSSAAEYPLVGSSFALHQYLKDATPLQVRVFRHKKSPQPSEESSNDALLQPELIGCASIPDVCIDKLLKLESAQDDSLKTTKLSLRRELQIFAPNLSSSNILIGEAVFELLYQFIGHSEHSEIKPHPPTDSRTQGLTRFQPILMNQMIELPVNQDRSQPPQTQKRYMNAYLAQPRFYKSDSVQSIIDDSIELQSELCTIRAEEEQKSLLEELLDFCSDDMTIPTIDSINTEIDPYDLWISRIVANASSPPAKEFPSLVSAGSCNSNALRKVGLLKLEIYEVILFSATACKIRGKNDFYLQYYQPPKAFASAEPSSGLVEFMVCAQFGARAKSQSARREQSKSSNDKGAKERNVPLLASNHMNQMEIAFDDDDTVRQWLDEVMKFSLFYRPSKPVSHLKLPRVAKLSGKSKGVTSMVPGKVCIAQSCLRLRDVILSKTFSSNVKVDLVYAKNNDELLQGVGGAGMKVGSLSVRLGLHCDDNGADRSILCSPTVSTASARAKMNEKRNSLLRRLQSSSPLKPHPISLFLTNFGWASNKNVGATTSNAKCTSSFPARAHKCDQIPPQDVHFNNARNQENMNVPLKPVKTPPVWLDIRVGCVSNLSIQAAHNSIKTGSLQLCMSFNEPILPENRLTHSYSYRNNMNKSLAGSEVCSQKIVKLRDGNSSNVLLSNNVCSWQVALDADSEGDKDRSLTLRVWYCSDGVSCDREKKTLIGLATIPFALEPTNGAKQNTCDWLPGVATNGWFNLLDPKSHNAPVGKVQVMIVAGMLRQIRSFPTVCKSVMAVQSWWRKSRSNKKKILKEKAVDPDSLVEEKSPRDNDPNFDMIGLVGKATMEQMGYLASSPDSLFEEWSQQSLPMTTVRNSNTRLCNNTIIIAQPAVDEINQKNHALEAPSKARVVDKESTQATDINNDTGRISTSSEEESETAGSFECNDISTTNGKAANVEDSASERTAACEKSGNEQSIDSISKGGNQFEILICLEKIYGIREIISLWNMQQGNSDINSLLSVSGVFVSYSLWDEKATTSHHEELHKLCVGKTEHSKLVPADIITLDVELNLEAKISMPNHETNTELILTQMLELKLWFVPIITTRIATMINNGQTKDMQILNGCKVISIAKCPLYHLYTLKGFYKGRVPWNMAVHGDKKNDKFIGCILISVSRANVQNRPLQLSTKGHVPSNTGENHAMSTLKPMNLEASFSHEQDDFTRHNKGIDPPEERKVTKSSSSKRKMEQSSVSLREFKRYRCMESPMPRTGKPPHAEISHENSPPNAQDSGEETDTICPSDTSFDWDRDSEINGAQTYRSLTSVMESLENIDSKLQQVGSFGDGSCDGLNPTTQAEKGPNVADGDPKGCQPFSQNHERPDSPRHQMEPLEENLVSETPTHGIAAPSVNNAGAVKICEKRISPVSMTRVCVDAATSPCGESLVDGKIEDRMARNHDLAHEEDAVEKCGTHGLRLEDTCTNGDDDPKGFNSQKRMYLDHSNRKRGGNNESLKYMQVYLANHGGRMGGISKRYRSPSTQSSYSLGILRSNRLRNTSILSPVLNLLSPSRHVIRAKRAGRIGKMDFRKDNGPNVNSHKRGKESILAEENNQHGIVGFMSDDKDRLERIFHS